VQDLGKEDEFPMNGDASDSNDSTTVEKCLDTVWRELNLDAVLALMDSRFQFEVVPFSLDTDPVWAYFPVHRRRKIAKFVEVKPDTRVLLVIFEPDVGRLPQEETLNKLRHHIGHVLRYLRDPKSKNDCSDAVMEWKKSRR